MLTLLDSQASREEKYELLRVVGEGLFGLQEFGEVFRVLVDNVRAWDKFDCETQAIND